MSSKFIPGVLDEGIIEGHGQEDWAGKYKNLRAAFANLQAEHGALQTRAELLQAGCTNGDKAIAALNALREEHTTLQEKCRALEFNARHIPDLVMVAEEYGWNGTSNSKILPDFFAQRLGYLRQMTNHLLSLENVINMELASQLPRPFLREIAISLGSILRPNSAPALPAVTYSLGFAGSRTRWGRTTQAAAREMAKELVEHIKAPTQVLCHEEPSGRLAFVAFNRVNESGGLGPVEFQVMESGVS